MRGKRESVGTRKGRNVRKTGTREWREVSVVTKKGKVKERDR